MNEQTRRPNHERLAEDHTRYERPAIVYRGKLEAFAISCDKTTVGCNGGSQSAS